MSGVVLTEAGVHAEPDVPGGVGVRGDPVGEGRVGWVRRFPIGPGSILRALTHIVPARYFVSLLKGIYLKGIGPQMLATDALFLAALLLLLPQQSTERLRWVPNPRTSSGSFCVP